MIEELLKAGLNFYFYRLPDEHEVKSSISSKILSCKKWDKDLLSIPGFAIYPFDNSCEEVIIIPNSESQVLENKYYISDSINYSFNKIPEDTTEEEHKKNVEFIVEWLRGRQAGGHSHEKVVLSRIQRHRLKVSLDELISTLLDKYKDLFVFCFNTSATGMWIGASPEKLLECDGEIVTAMSLAGTRPSETQEEWDIKNREEQEIVTRYIVDTFEQNGLEPRTEGPFTKYAGPVEHLCTAVSACVETSALNELLFSLTPTPALCGYPKKDAIELISQLEKHDRGCYGGFCGPVEGSGRFSFFVNIRSMCIKEGQPKEEQPKEEQPKEGLSKEEHCILLTGGGITVRSIPAQEWEETTRKASTLLRILNRDPGDQVAGNSAETRRPSRREQ